MSHSMPSKFDIAIIGGGILGSATAYFLQEESPGNSLRVLEPDPTYEFASPLRASGGCRVQFTCQENIAMSLYSIDFIKAFEQAMASNGRPAPVDWVGGGYLFIVPPDNVSNLERNVRRQRSVGCVVDLLTPQELKHKFPSLNVDDLGAGAHTPRDGWCDPNGLLWGFRRKAVELGAVYVKDRVVAIEMEKALVRAVVLASGERVAADLHRRVLSTSAFGGLFEEKAFGQKCLCDVLDVLRGYAAGVEVVSPGSDSRYDFVDLYSGRLYAESEALTLGKRVVHARRASISSNRHRKVAAFEADQGHGHEIVRRRQAPTARGSPHCIVARMIVVVRHGSVEDDP